MARLAKVESSSLLYLSSIKVRCLIWTFRFFLDGRAFEINLFLKMDVKLFFVLITAGTSSFRFD